ncbi:hypothetical protein ONZ45_g5745 [Pleurotus djamor]|nr:hypothetical protein ONZ45_g5745 [Pleurotus djamor]
MSPPPPGVSGDASHSLVKRELPPEIIDLIITDYTNALEDRRPIRHLLLVSRLFYSIYAPVLYESLYLTDSDEDVPREHAPCTILTPHHLSELQVALSAKMGLPKLIQKFSVREEFQKELTPPECAALELIFASLTSLTRLYIPSIPGPPSSPPRPIPKTTELSHLTYASRWMKSPITTFLETQRSLQYLSCVHLNWDDFCSIFSPRFSGLPNLHTLECSQDTFCRVSLAEFPALEHVIVQMSTRLFPVTNQDFLPRLRTLYITCKPSENLFELLRSLERIEYLFTGLRNVAVIEYNPLPALLDIPSKELKYIYLRPIRFYDDSLIVHRLFNAHTNLVIVDVCSTRPDPCVTESILIVTRYVRLGQSGEGKGFGVLKKFSVPQPKVFESWWEVAEIQDDVEEARGK